MHLIFCALYIYKKKKISHYHTCTQVEHLHVHKEWSDSSSQGQWQGSHFDCTRASQVHSKCQHQRQGILCHWVIKLHWLNHYVPWCGHVIYLQHPPKSVWTEESLRQGWGGGRASSSDIEIISSNHVTWYK